VLIARGRNPADVGISTAFDPNALSSVSVPIEEVRFKARCGGPRLALRPTR
jgi:hypothetical protein